MWRSRLIERLRGRRTRRVRLVLLIVDRRLCIMTRRLHVLSRLRVRVIHGGSQRRLSTALRRPGQGMRRRDRRCIHRTRGRRPWFLVRRSRTLRAAQLLDRSLLCSAIGRRLRSRLRRPRYDMARRRWSTRHRRLRRRARLGRLTSCVRLHASWCFGRSGVHRLCRGAPLRAAEDLPFCGLPTLRREGSASWVRHGDKQDTRRGCLC